MPRLLAHGSEDTTRLETLGYEAPFDEERRAAAPLNGVHSVRDGFHRTIEAVFVLHPDYRDGNKVVSRRPSLDELDNGEDLRGIGAVEGWQ